MKPQYVSILAITLLCMQCYRVPQECTPGATKKMRAHLVKLTAAHKDLAKRYDKCMECTKESFDHLCKPVAATLNFFRDERLCRLNPTLKNTQRSLKVDIDSLYGSMGVAESLAGIIDWHQKKIFPRELFYPSPEKPSEQEGNPADKFRRTPSPAKPTPPSDSPTESTPSNREEVFSMKNIVIPRAFIV